MVAAHRLEPHHGAVARIAMSSRDKGLITATDAGEIWLRHMTSEQVLARLTLPAGAVGGGDRRSRPRPTASSRSTPPATPGRGTSTIRIPRPRCAPSSARSGTRATTGRRTPGSLRAATTTSSPSSAWCRWCSARSRPPCTRSLFAVPIALCGGDLHLAVPRREGAHADQATDRDHGIAPERRARFRRRAGPGARRSRTGWSLCSRRWPWLRWARSRLRLPVAAAAAERAPPATRAASSSRS